MSGARDYRWVDEGLAALDLRLDLEERELPHGLRGEAPSVDRLMRGAVALISNSGEWMRDGVEASGPSWRAVVGRVPGNPCLVQRTTISGPLPLSREGFLKFALDGAMTEAAPLWDQTFVSARFSHVIVPPGEILPITEAALRGRRFAEVAKIMRLVFTVPGLADRELLAVYVSHGDAETMTCCYLPVRGARFPAARRPVRARLMVPCLDHARFRGDTCSEVIHVASADIGGWMPGFIKTSGFYRRAFLDNARREAGHLLDLLRGEGRAGDAFLRLGARDGMLAPAS